MFLVAYCVKILLDALRFVENSRHAAKYRVLQVTCRGENDKSNQSKHRLYLVI